MKKITIVKLVIGIISAITGIFYLISTFDNFNAVSNVRETLDKYSNKYSDAVLEGLKESLREAEFSAFTVLLTTLTFIGIAVLLFMSFMEDRAQIVKVPKEIKSINKQAMIIEEDDYQIHKKFSEQHEVKKIRYAFARIVNNKLSYYSISVDIQNLRIIKEEDNRILATDGIFDYDISFDSLEQKQSFLLYFNN